MLRLYKTSFYCFNPSIMNEVAQLYTAREYSLQEHAMYPIALSPKPWYVPLLRRSRERKYNNSRHRSLQDRPYCRGRRTGRKWCQGDKGSMADCMLSHIINHTLIKHRYTTLPGRVLIIKPEILVELNKHHSIHGMLVQMRVNTDGKSRACTKRHTTRTITLFSMPIWLSIRGWNSSPRCTLKGNGPFWEDLQSLYSETPGYALPA